MFERIDKSYDKNSLQTPQYVFDWLNSIYKFKVDLAASEEHHLCEWFYTLENSALKADWHHPLKRICGFVNPPYGHGLIMPFLTKAVEEQAKGFTTVALIPELNGESRTKIIIENATNIYHFDKRLNFINPVTKEECKGNNRGSIVVEFSHTYVKIQPNHIIISLDEIKDQYS